MSNKANFNSLGGYLLCYYHVEDIKGEAFEFPEL